MAFTIEFSPDAHDHLRALRKRDQRIVVDAIANQLAHQPDQPTAHRKPLEDNPIAPWELRVGDFRVFYDIDREDQVIGRPGSRSEDPQPSADRRRGG